MTNIVGIHITNQGIATSQGDIITEPPFLGYLVSCYPNSQKVLYDMDASVASLAHLIELTEEEAKRFLDKEQFYCPPYRLTYFPTRFFAIDKGFFTGHDYANFANMAQAGYLETHYTEDNSLEDAVKKAKEAQRVGEEVAQAFQRLGLPTNKLSSPISAFLSNHELSVPTVDDYPPEVAEMAWNAARGGWTEVYTEGHFDAYDFDLNGSYAFELAKLLDIRNGDWIQSKVRPPNAVYSFTEGLLNTQAYFHPFIVRIGDNNYTPTSRYPAILALVELGLMQRHNLGEFTIDDAWWWIPKGQQRKPYQGAVTWLWQKRTNPDCPQIDRFIIQRIYSSLYGLSLMTTKTKGQTEFAPSFNPVYGATIEASSRCHVAETCLQHGITPLAVLVDGFITDKDLPLETTKELGGWKLSYKGNCIITGNNAIAFEGKTDETGELALKYDWLLNEINARPKANHYTRAKYSPITLAEALARDYTKLGQIERKERAVLIGQDTKRAFVQRPKCGQDLLDNAYDSQPWSYQILATKKGEAPILLPF